MDSGEVGRPAPSAMLNHARSFSKFCFDSRVRSIQRRTLIFLFRPALTSVLSNGAIYRPAPTTA